MIWGVAWAVVGNVMLARLCCGFRQAGVEQDSLDRGDRCRDVVVIDDAMLVVMRLQQLPMGHLQPTGHRFRRFRSPAPKTLKELLGVGRLDEDRDRIRIPCQNRKCTLDVDFEHDPLP